VVARTLVEQPRGRNNRTSNDPRQHRYGRVRCREEISNENTWGWNWDLRDYIPDGPLDDEEDGLREVMRDPREIEVDSSGPPCIVRLDPREPGATEQSGRIVDAPDDHPGCPGVLHQVGDLPRPLGALI